MLPNVNVVAFHLSNKMTKNLMLPFVHTYHILNIYPKILSCNLYMINRIDFQTKSATEINLECRYIFR